VEAGYFQIWSHIIKTKLKSADLQQVNKYILRHLDNFTALRENLQILHKNLCKLGFFTLLLVINGVSQKLVCITPLSHEQIIKLVQK